MIKKICIWTGASRGKKSIFIESAEKLGQFIAAKGLELIYGGSNIGLMGAIARTSMKYGAKVTSVITEDLANTVDMLETDEIIYCHNMHDRKQRMFELADAFVALPGGFGTLDEMFEMVTWLQLGIHNKPIGIYNIDNYYSKLIEFLLNAVDCGFIKKEHFDMLVIDDNPENILDKFTTFSVPTIGKWWD